VHGTIHGPGYSGAGASALWSTSGPTSRTTTTSSRSTGSPDHPFYLVLNVAVGGTVGGPVVPRTTFPQALTVDYVRVYEPG
jgi:beta-glucanase (GH16 family)